MRAASRPLSNSLAKCRGRFLISRTTFTQAPGLIIRVQMELIITRCEYAFRREAFTYDAFGPIFKEQPNQIESPWYLLDWKADLGTPGSNAALTAEMVGAACWSFPHWDNIPENFKLVPEIEEAPTETTNGG